VLDAIEDKSLIPADRSKDVDARRLRQVQQTGYKGRVGVYEAVLTDEKIENAVEMNPSEREIWAAAKGQGLLTMKQDGISRSLQGMTSLAELERVIAMTD
jgi:type II secretory ATPase GspE/PulE/Tfp pilus assembly ATPase PilB-like protein